MNSVGVFVYLVRLHSIRICNLVIGEADADCLPIWRLWIMYLLQLMILSMNNSHYLRSTLEWMKFRFRGSHKNPDLVFAPKIISLFSLIYDLHLWLKYHVWEIAPHRCGVCKQMSTLQFSRSVGEQSNGQEKWVQTTTSSSELDTIQSF